MSFTHNWHADLVSHPPPATGFGFGWSVRTPYPGGGGFNDYHNYPIQPGRSVADVFNPCGFGAGVDEGSGIVTITGPDAAAVTADPTGYGLVSGDATALTNASTSFAAALADSDTIAASATAA